MRVLLIRHFKVDHQWKKSCMGNEFFTDIEDYNTRQVVETKELDYPIKTVYISTLSRTEETARHLKGDKHIIKTHLINEVDLRGKTSINFRLPGIIWYIISVAKWKTYSIKQNETYKYTQKRALEFLRIIEEKNEDCIVVSHGMFLMVLMNIMMREGYEGGKRTKRIENGEVNQLSKQFNK